jgi:hypothetical protein
MASTGRQCVGPKRRVFLMEEEVGSSWVSEAFADSTRVPPFQHPPIQKVVSSVSRAQD